MNGSRVLQRRLGRISFYPELIQREGDFAVLHEPAPDVAGAHVLGAEEDYAGVDADDVCVDPAGFGIKGVDEAVLAVNLITELFAHRL